MARFKNIPHGFVANSAMRFWCNAVKNFAAPARNRGYVTPQRRLVPHQKFPPHLRRFWCNAY